MEDILSITGYQTRKRFNGNHSGRTSAQVQLVTASPGPNEAEDESEMQDIDYQLIVKLVHHIHVTKPKDEAILVFLPGWEDISRTQDLLKNTPISCPSGPEPSTSLIIIPLHSMIPTMNQRQVFNKAPADKRKVIIATNIAETSITVEDVVYVIDGGKTKIQVYDANIGISCLAIANIARSSCKQRAGRAGRCRPGVCYHMFTRAVYESLPVCLPPEMQRASLDEVVLQIHALNLGNANSFLSEAMEPPPQDLVNCALNALISSGALTYDQQLTTLGRILARLPVDPRLGKMLIYGLIFQCIDAMLTLVAFLSVKDPFVMPIGKQRYVEAARVSFSGPSKSDHIGYLNIYRDYTSCLAHQ